MSLIHNNKSSTQDTGNNGDAGGTFPPTAIILHKTVPEEVCRFASDQSIIVEDGSMIPLDYVIRETTSDQEEVREISSAMKSSGDDDDDAEDQRQQQRQFVSIDDATRSVSKWLSGTFSLACSRFHILVIGGSQLHRQQQHSEFDCLTHSICPGYQNDTILPHHQNESNEQQQQQPMRIISYFDGEHDYREFCFWNCDVLFAENCSDENATTTSFSILPSPEKISSILSMSVSLGFAAVVWYPPRNEELSEEFARTACQFAQWKKRFIVGMQRTMANRPIELLGLLDRDEYHLLLRDMIVSHRLTLSYPHEMLPFIDEVIEKLAAPFEGDDDEEDNDANNSSGQSSVIVGDGVHENPLSQHPPVGLTATLEEQQQQQQQQGISPVLPPLSNTVTMHTDDNTRHDTDQTTIRTANQQQTSATTGATLKSSSSLSSPMSGGGAGSSSSFSAKNIFRQEIQRLQAENLQLRSQTNPLKVKMDEMERENAQLRFDKLSAEKQSRSVAADNDNLVSQIHQLEERLEKSEKKLVTYEQQSSTNNSTSEKVLILEREVSRLKNEVNTERDAKKQLEEKLVILSSETSSSTTRNNSNHEQQQQQQQSMIIIQDLRNQVEKLDRELLEMERQNSSLQQQLVAATTNNNNNSTSRPSTPNSSSTNPTTSVLIQSIRDQEKTKTERALRELDQVRRESETKITNLSKENKSLKEELALVEKNVEELKQQHRSEMDQFWRQSQENEERINDERGNERQEFEKRIQESKEELVKQEQEFADQKSTLEKTLIAKNESDQNQLRQEYEARLSQMNEEQQIFERQLDQKQQMISSIESENTRLKQQLDSQKQELDSTQNQNIQLQSQLEQLQNEQKSMESSFLFSTKEEKERAEKLASEKNELEESYRDTDTKLQEMMKKLKMVESDLDDERLLAEKWKRKYEEAQNEMKEEHDKIMKEVTENLATVQAENSTLSTQLLAAQTQLETLKIDLADSEEKREHLKSAHKATCDSLAKAERERSVIAKEAAEAAEKMQDLESFRKIRDLEERSAAAEEELTRLRETSSSALSQLEMERRTNARLSLEIAKIDKELLRRSVEASEKVPTLLAELKRVKRVANEMALQVETMKLDNQDGDGQEKSNISTSFISSSNTTSILHHHNDYEETKEALRQSEMQNSKLTQELQLLHLQVTNLIDQVGTDAQKEAIRVAEGAKLRAAIQQFVHQQEDNISDDEDSETLIASSTPIAKRGEGLTATSRVVASSSRPPLSPSSINHHEDGSSSSSMMKKRRSATTPPPHGASSDTSITSPSSPNSARKKLLVDAMEYQRRELEWQQELQKLREENIRLANDMLDKKAKQREVAALALIWNSGKKNTSNSENEENQQEQQHVLSSSSATSTTNRRLDLVSDADLLEALNRHTHAQNMRLNEGRLAREGGTAEKLPRSRSAGGGKVRSIYL